MLIITDKYIVSDWCSQCDVFSCGRVSDIRKYNTTYHGAEKKNGSTRSTANS
jgi:hypothetical protein